MNFSFLDGSTSYFLIITICLLSMSCTEEIIVPCSDENWIGTWEGMNCDDAPILITIPDDTMGDMLSCRNSEEDVCKIFLVSRSHDVDFECDLEPDAMVINEFPSQLEIKVSFELTGDSLIYIVNIFSGFNQFTCRSVLRKSN